MTNRQSSITNFLPTLPCVRVGHVLKSLATTDPPSDRQCLNLNFRLSQCRSVATSKSMILSTLVRFENSCGSPCR
jgi:hypothetical protein